MYSTSYLHEGACKTWYGISSRNAALFESVFSEAFPTPTTNDPQLFTKKASMVPPWLLLEQGVIQSCFITHTRHSIAGG